VTRDVSTTLVNDTVSHAYLFVLAARAERARGSRLSRRERNSEKREVTPRAHPFTGERVAQVNGANSLSSVILAETKRVGASEGARPTRLSIRAFVASSDYQAAGCLTSKREVGAEKEQTAIFRMRDSLFGPTCYVGYCLRALRDLSRNLRSRDFSLPRQKYLPAGDLAKVRVAPLCSFGKFISLHPPQRAPFLR